MDDNQLALNIQKLHKHFRLPHDRSTSLKQHVLNFRRQSHEDFHVLNDINFSVKKGEFFGIIGRNGSGKSTLLKIIGGIYQPSSGEVTVHGTLTPFIELGIGFNPELTGRDNVFLNGAILGLTRKQVADLYDDIVAFAELEKFMDQKLKNYSSGMQVRLAFSIAIRAHNDILLIDEVLAVGDSTFQKKCVDFFSQVKGKRTVIFVSHDMRSIEKFCDRVLILEKSKVIDVGAPQDMIFRYGAIMADEQNEVKKRDGGERGIHVGSGEARIEQVELRGEDGRAVKSVQEGKPFAVRMHFTANTTLKKPVFHVSLFDSQGSKLFSVNTESSKYTIDTLPKRGHVDVYIKENPLAAGTYKINAGIFSEGLAFPYDHFRDALSCTIVGVNPASESRLNLPVSWKMQSKKS